MKKFAIVAVLLIAIASMAFSQAKPGGMARELAMGGSQAGTGLVMNPFLMDDATLLLVNPAYAVAYKDYAWMNIGGGTVQGANSNDNGYGKQNAGVAFGLSNEWAVGVIFGYDPSLASLNSQLPSAIVQGRSSQSIPSINNTWEAVIAMHGANLDLGLGVMYGNSNNNVKQNQVSPAASAENEASSSVFGVRAGAVVGLGNGNSLDLSAALRMDKANDKATSAPLINSYTGEYSASMTEIQVNVRAKFNVSPKFNFVPYGFLLSGSGEPKEDTRTNGVTTSPDAIKASVTAYALGAGGEYKVGNFLLAGGLSYQSAQVKEEFTPAGGTTSTLTVKYSALPVVNAGMEWMLNDWLTGRAGYTRSLGTINQKQESTTGSIEISQTFPMSWAMVGGINPSTWDGVVTLGVGFHFNNFALDATVSDEALRRGFGLVGSQDNINTFGYVSASYNFGE